jgi:hypothetical protein
MSSVSQAYFKLLLVFCSDYDVSHGSLRDSRMPIDRDLGLDSKAGGAIAA